MKNKNNNITAFYFGNKKSQSVVVDLFIALFVFVLIISIITIMWNKYNLDINQKINQKEMWLKVYHITDLLVESSGSPNNWYTLDDFENIKSIGLANLDRQLSSEKLVGFLTLSLGNYSLTKKLLNIEGFEFHFILFDLDGIIAESGLSPIFYGSTISGRTTSIRRYVSLDECEKCIFEFSLWKWE